MTPFIERAAKRHNLNKQDILDIQKRLNDVNISPEESVEESLREVPNSVCLQQLLDGKYLFQRGPQVKKLDKKSKNKDVHTGEKIITFIKHHSNKKDGKIKEQLPIPKIVKHLVHRKGKEVRKVAEKLPPSTSGLYQIVKKPIPPKPSTLKDRRYSKALSHLEKKKDVERKGSVRWLEYSKEVSNRPDNKIRLVYS